MDVNTNLVDRIVRVVLGLALIAMVFVGPQTAWGWLGVILILTAVTGRCPIYRVFGWSTCPVDKPPGNSTPTH